MESRIQKTLENHRKGYNCAQSVACAYCDLVGLDEQSVFRATEAFGLGMGGMQATCGAVSGAVMLAGLKNSCGELEAPVSKGKTYQISKQLVEAFQKKNGSLVCKELKGVETGSRCRSDEYEIEICFDRLIECVSRSHNAELLAVSADYSYFLLADILVDELFFRADIKAPPF